MSLYNLLFGKNSQTALILAIVGFKENDIERFRDVTLDPSGKHVGIYARTGGGNREDYPQAALKASPLYLFDEDDGFDSTYATFYLRVPSEFQEDACHLDNILEHGLRPEFAQHLAKTLNRAPTAGDIEAQLYEKERAALARHKHILANGHTFVPLDDFALIAACTIAEQNDGKLRTAWHILPLKLEVRRNFLLYPAAPKIEDRSILNRHDLRAMWSLDEDYYKHILQHYLQRFPRTFARMQETIANASWSKSL